MGIDVKEGQCSLWLLDIRLLEGLEGQWMPLLTPERRKRVERCKIQMGKLELAAAGLLMRAILGVTEDRQLSVNEHGKLSLTGGSPCFNLSHGGNYAVLAVASGSVGVDIEPVGENMPIRIPKRFLLPDEIAWLESEPTGTRFAWLWTRLESVLKADGRGFGMGQRTYSLLQEKGPWYVDTIFRDSHCISCAIEVPSVLHLHSVEIETLLMESADTR